MDKWEKAGIAKDNSERFKVGRPEYKATDGRTYVLDKKVPSAAPNIKTCALRLRRGRPSLMAVYRIEHWLSGKGRYTKNNVPTAERARIMAEYGLEFSQRLQQYFASEESVWEKLLAKYPEKIRNERIRSYAELAYRAESRR